MVGALLAVTRWLLVISTFVASAIAGLLIHLDFEVTRTVVCDVVNAVLRDTFAGTLQLGRIERLTPDELRVTGITAADPDGERVLDLDAAQVRGPWLERMLLAAIGRDLDVPFIRLERAEIALFSSARFW